MKLLFYYTRETEQTRSLGKVISSMVPCEAIDVCRSIEIVLQRFRNPADHIDLTVIAVSDLAELEALRPQEYLCR